MQGAQPLASPGLNPRGTGKGGEPRARRGGLPCLSPACPAFSLLFCPLSPPPPFPGGEGGDSRLFHARGFAPCIPSIKPLAALAEPEKQAPGEGLPPALPVDLAAVVLAGGLPCLSPADPAFCFPFCPLSPHPLPRLGRGRFKVISCKGLRPLHPRGLNPGGTCTTKGFCLFTGGQCRQPRRGGTGGEELRRLRWSSPPGQG